MKRIGAALLVLMMLLAAGAAGAEDTPTEVTEIAEAEIPGKEAAEAETPAEPGAPAPEWADVKLNSRGFIDEGEYIFEDNENGHWMYVSPTLRIEIVRTLETPEKKKKSDKMQQFYCFTAEIWCDVENGELPKTIWSDPENPRGRNTEKFSREIAEINHAVFATSTDYYTYRVDKKKKDGGNVGIVIRDGEILYNHPVKNREKSMPNYETLAIFADGHVESWPNTEKKAEKYIAEGAQQVYTFGPCLVRDGELTEYILKHANRSLNPRHAFGMVEPEHFVDVICEGRLWTKQKILGEIIEKRSTGVMMETLAEMMIAKGCKIAVNLDGGQTAVMAFMGKQLNYVVKTDPYGRKTFEMLGFGSWSE